MNSLEGRKLDKELYKLDTEVESNIEYAKCDDCSNKGLPSGYHEVSRDGKFIYINCSTCGKLVAKLKIGES